MKTLIVVFIIFIILIGISLIKRKQIIDGDIYNIKVDSIAWSPEQVKVHYNLTLTNIVPKGYGIVSITDTLTHTQTPN